MKSYSSNLLKYIDELKKGIHDSNSSKQGLFKKKQIIEIAEEPKIIDDYNFNRTLTNYTWSLASLSNILAYIELAIANNDLVEITVVDG